jgi:hypothetical protein
MQSNNIQNLLNTFTEEEWLALLSTQDSALTQRNSDQPPPPPLQQQQLQFPIQTNRILQALQETSRRPILNVQSVNNFNSQSAARSSHIDNQYVNAAIASATSHAMDRLNHSVGHDISQETSHSPRHHHQPFIGPHQQLRNTRPTIDPLVSVASLTDLQRIRQIQAEGMLRSTGSMIDQEVMASMGNTTTGTSNTGTGNSLLINRLQSLDKHMLQDMIQREIARRQSLVNNNNMPLLSRGNHLATTGLQNPASLIDNVPQFASLRHDVQSGITDTSLINDIHQSASLRVGPDHNPNLKRKAVTNSNNESLITEHAQKKQAPITRTPDTTTTKTKKSKTPTAKTSTDGASPNKKRQVFPNALYQLLMDMEKQGKTDIISFKDTGTAFCIHKPKEFQNHISPYYFSHGKLASFKRQLQIYNFERVDPSGSETAGDTAAATAVRGGPTYAHPLFVRGKPELLDQIQRDITSYQDMRFEEQQEHDGVSAAKK